MIENEQTFIRLFLLIYGQGKISHVKKLYFLLKRYGSKQNKHQFQQVILQFHQQICERYPEYIHPSVRMDFHPEADHSEIRQ